MATLTTNGRLKMIRFPFQGKRRTLRLGRMSESGARLVLSHVEELINAAGAQHPIASATLAWTKAIDGKLHGRLSAMGLLPSRSTAAAGAVVTIQKLFDDYLGRRVDLKKRTVDKISQAGKSLVKFFGQCDFKSINVATANDWRRAEAKKMALASISTHVRKSRQVFTDAVSRKMTDSNPFLSVKTGSQANELRKHYVSTDQIFEVIEKCPDREWATIFALARFAGLRIPSEIEDLKWTDIDWDRGRMIIHSPKTAHHEGHERRTIPIFELLWPILDECLREAHDGALYVIDRHRGENLRTQAIRIIKLAGLEVWEKPFQNLRASCETDLAMNFPLHVVCSWIGNSAVIARKHYFMITEADYSAACGAPKSGARSTIHTAIPTGSGVDVALGSFIQAQKYPRQGSETHKIARDFQKAHRALQKRLHREIRRQESTDNSDLAILQAAVDRAKAGA